MRNKFYFIWLLVFISCNSNIKIEKDIISKWDVDKVEYVNLNKFAPDGVNEGAYFDFKENGEVELSNYLQGIRTGRWNVLNDTIFIEIDNETPRFRIEKMNERELILSTRIDKNDELLKFYLIRMEK